MSVVKYYTLIGSRSTPDDIYKVMVKLASKLKSEGYIVRSGGATGADSAAEEGCTVGTLESANIYLPWNGYNGKHFSERCYIDVSKLKNLKEAELIVSNTHPAWNNCSRGVRSLHTRNVYQILGTDLKTPSKFVVCWAEPKDESGNVKGGTGTAVSLALQNNIKVINLYREDDLNRVLEYLGGNK